jgi:hypothetical protein
MAFVQSLLQESSDNEAFLKVSRIFAHTYLANTSKAKPLDAKELAGMYGQSLVAIQRSLRNGEVSDATIAAVWLLGQYEVS